jgi:hypothetical protein
MSLHLQALPLVKASLDDLDSVNKEFDDVYDKRSRKRQEMADKGSMQEARLKTDEAYQVMQQLINSLLVMETDRERLATLETMVYEVSSYMQQVMRGGKRSPYYPEPQPETPTFGVTGLKARNPLADPTGVADLMQADVAEADRRTVLGMRRRLTGTHMRLTYREEGFPEFTLYLPFKTLVENDEDLEAPLYILFDRPDRDRYYTFPLEVYGTPEAVEAAVISKDGKTVLATVKGMLMPGLVTEP